MKLRHVRISRVAIKFFSWFRHHVVFVSVCLFLFLFSALGILGYQFLRRHDVKPLDLLGFFGTPVESLNSTGGVTNFLILGIRGEGLDSPNLSDTIIVGSYNHETKQPSMFGVPRDLWVPSLKARINTAYHYGEEASPGAGIQMAQAAILEDLGLPVHYTAVVNFSLFKQAIDLVGGIDVDVNPGFTDTKFPIPGKETALPISSRYETITFPAGINHFDGETALKFVRSRHSDGDEGTDISRSERQQLVVNSLREKILTPAFLLDQKKVESLIDIVSRNLITNIPSRLYPALAKLALDSQEKELNSFGLSYLPDKDGVTILYHPPVSKYNGEWVLIPKDNNWNALKQYVRNHLTLIK